MSALASPNIALFTKPVDDPAREVDTAAAAYGGSFMMKASDGEIVPLSTSAGAFAGFLNAGGGTIATTDAERKYTVSRKGCFLATITSVAKTDLGKPVYCGTDNPADCTLTWASGKKMVGWVRELLYDRAGAVANKCWVEYDVDAIQRTKIIELVGNTGRPLADSSCEEAMYVCPVGRKAKIVALSYEYAGKPNFATTDVLLAQKITGTTRTTALSTPNVDVNNTAVAVDTVTPMTLTATGADLLLAAGDRLVCTQTAAGALTASHSIKVYATIEEYEA